VGFQPVQKGLYPTFGPTSPCVTPPADTTSLVIQTESRSVASLLPCVAGIRPNSVVPNTIRVSNIPVRLKVLQATPAGSPRPFHSPAVP